MEYNKAFPTRFIFEKADLDTLKERQFKYKEDRQEMLFDVKDIIPFFDIANGLSEDFLLKAPSRLCAIQKNIKNIDTALTAENNALEKAGRFIVSSSVKGNAIARALDPTEKKEIEDSFKGFGMGKRKGNITVTKAMLDAQSLHVPMNQLGISESVASNSMVIINAFGMPRELYTLDSSGATYENQSAAMVNLIQNVVQPQIDDFCNSYKDFFEIEGEFKGSLDHLPAMQTIEDRKADKALKISAAIRNIAGTGMTNDELFQMAGINQEENE